MAVRHPDFDLAGWRVSPKLNRISRGNRSVSVKHKAMAVLVRLAEANGEVVTRDEIMDAVWPGMVVSNDVLTQSVVELRKALVDDAKHPRIIETIPRIGFRLLAEAVPASGGDAKSRAKGIRQSVLLTSLTVVAFGFSYWAIQSERQQRSPVITVQDHPSIVVLPFINMSDDPGHSLIADGLAEGIRNLLTRIENLKVIARTSSQAFDQKGHDVREIADALGVDFVLEGSVQEVSSRVRISVRLVDVEDGSTIWSESYDELVTDIFAIQDSVAADAMTQLEVHVGTFPARGRTLENFDAYLQFLEAKVAMNEHDIFRAIDLLKDVTAREPSFAEAFEYMSYIYWALGGNPFEIRQAHRLAHDAAAKAIDIDSNLAFARALYESGGVDEFSLARALNAIHRSLARQPSNAQLLEAHYFVLTVTGYLQEALGSAQRLVNLDPYSRQARFSLAMSLYAVDRSDDARAALKGLDWSYLDPDFYKWMIEGINFVEHRDEDAIESFEQYFNQHDYSNSTWFRELVIQARDPATGVTVLDSEIPGIVASMAQQDAFNWQEGLLSLYLYLGYFDRFLEIVLEEDFDAASWFAQVNQIWQANTFRITGVTASPEYLELMRRARIVDVWEERGPPDFCRKVASEWTCH